MRSYTAIAIEKLAHLVQHAKSEQACIAAASELLSRGWGKPTQPIKLVDLFLKRIDCGDWLGC
jgi:hypothetical protein